MLDMHFRLSLLPRACKAPLSSGAATVYQLQVWPRHPQLATPGQSLSLTSAHSTTPSPQVQFPRLSAERPAVQRHPSSSMHRLVSIKEDQASSLPTFAIPGHFHQREQASADKQSSSPLMGRNLMTLSHSSSMPCSQPWVSSSSSSSSQG